MSWWIWSKDNELMPFSENHAISPPSLRHTKYQWFPYQVIKSASCPIHIHQFPIFQPLAHHFPHWAGHHLCVEWHSGGGSIQLRSQCSKSAGAGRRRRISLSCLWSRKSAVPTAGGSFSEVFSKSCVCRAGLLWTISSFRNSQEFADLSSTVEGEILTVMKTSPENSEKSDSTNSSCLPTAEAFKLRRPWPLAPCWGLRAASTTLLQVVMIILDRHSGVGSLWWISKSWYRLIRFLRWFPSWFSNSSSTSQCTSNECHWFLTTVTVPRQVTHVILAFATWRLSFIDVIYISRWEVSATVCSLMGTRPPESLRDLFIVSFGHHRYLARCTILPTLGTC